MLETNLSMKYKPTNSPALSVAHGNVHGHSVEYPAAFILSTVVPPSNGSHDNCCKATKVAEIERIYTKFLYFLCLTKFVTHLLDTNRLQIHKDNKMYSNFDRIILFYLIII